MTTTTNRKLSAICSKCGIHFDHHPHELSKEKGCYDMMLEVLEQFYYRADKMRKKINKSDQ